MTRPRMTGSTEPCTSAFAVFIAVAGTSGLLAAAAAFLILRRAGMFAWRDAAAMWRPGGPPTGVIDLSEIPDPRTEEPN